MSKIEFKLLGIVISIVKKPDEDAATISAIYPPQSYPDSNDSISVSKTSKEGSHNEDFADQNFKDGNLLVRKNVKHLDRLGFYVSLATKPAESKGVDILLDGSLRLNK